MLQSWPKYPKHIGALWLPGWCTSTSDRPASFLLKCYSGRRTRDLSKSTENLSNGNVVMLSKEVVCCHQLTDRNLVSLRLHTKATHARKTQRMGKKRARYVCKSSTVRRSASCGVLSEPARCTSALHIYKRTTQPGHPGPQQKASCNWSSLLG